jgi:hypothetical protein
MPSQNRLERRFKKLLLSLDMAICIQTDTRLSEQWQIHIQHNEEGFWIKAQFY